ncbi:DUF3486 family protein [Rhodocyclus tenuis]|uniref:Beta-phosphoglucomutase-like phosphatase (HAD superfamily) n=1 Tax=Rhodocyclus tenuis TaxID=1066 RepID=A0A840G774_RHOTE|nr:DUF3486 family protein [Rhodocyclus tenuis]MBB4247261.1 beta-phosphoglucomutase-like phosphatase (HAD superfamily) [Rhodocyclus tenuis]
MARRSNIDGLPEDVRRWLERALAESNFSGYQALEEMMRERGYSISKSAIHRYGQKIERRFAAIKASTEAARFLTEGAADDQDARSEAVIALVQTELFESIVNLQEADEEGVKPEDRIGLLSKAAKNIATLARASVNQKKFRLEVQEETRRKLLEEQAKKLDALQKKGGVTPETQAAIREALGIS